MKSGITVTKDRIPQILKSLRALPKKDVLVGIPAENGLRTNDDGSPLTNAQIGYIQNFGAPEANIPQREFLAPGIKDVQERINALFAQAGLAACDGKPEVVERCLHAAGLVASNGVKAKIQNGPFLELAPRTLAQRRARGRTGIKPLLDTGQLRNAVTYVIRERR